MALIASSVRPLQAQDSGPPDLEMLLNLDLFRPQPQQGETESGDANSSNSTLDQIRTLNALGYLGNSNYPNPAAGEGTEEEGPQPPAPPPSQETPE
jgi:hypothetical protein